MSRRKSSINLTAKPVLIVRIAKPLLLITTPLGLLDGFYECYKLAGGLLFLMVAMVVVLTVGFGTVIATVRREERAAKAKNI
jgi:hypothetical protein